MGFLRFDKTPLRLKKVAQSAGFLFLILGSFYFLFNDNLAFAKDINMGTAGDRILLNGNIGIGTTNPQDTLHVVTPGSNLATIRLQPGNGAQYGQINYDRNNNSVNFLLNGSSAYLSILNSGNVGINQTNPTVKLQITGGGIDANGTVNGTGLCIANDCKVSWGAIVSAGGGSLWGGAMDGNIWNGTSGGGKVGIGTTVPTAKLDVVGNITLSAPGSRDSRYLLINRGSGGYDQAVVGWGTANTIDWNMGHLYSGGGPTPNLYISEADQINNGSGVLVKTPIITMTKGAGTDSGNVGIGTTAPLSKLDIVNNRASDVVAGATDVTLNLQESVAGVRSAIRFGGLAANGGGGNMGMISWSAGASGPVADNKLSFTAEAQDTLREDLVILGNGNVGINQTNPTVKLQITGGGIDANGTVNGTGLCIAGDCKVSWPSIVAAGGGNLWGGALDGTIWNGTSGGGNVGIGTTGPGAKLEVFGTDKGILINKPYGYSSQTLANVRAYYALAIAPLRSGGTGGLYFTNYDADVPLIQSVNSSDVAQSLLINPLGGNVGIGTTGPNYILDVSGSLNAASYFGPLVATPSGGYSTPATGLNAASVYDRITYFDGYGAIIPNSPDSGWWEGALTIGNSTRGIQIVGSYNGQDLYLRKGQDGGTWRAWQKILVENTSGNVGIGQTNPTVKLQITGGGIDANGTVNGTGLCIAGDCKVSWGAIVSAGGGSLWGGTLDGNIWNGTSGGGNVGIGTTAPYLSLDVARDNATIFSGTGYRTSVFHSTPAVNVDQPGIQLGYDTAGGGIIAPATQNGNTNFLEFWTYNGGWGERMRLTKDGNVGIGTTNPLYKEEVNGTFKASANSSSIILDASGNILIGI